MTSVTTCVSCPPSPTVKLDTIHVGIDVGSDITVVTTFSKPIVVFMAKDTGSLTRENNSERSILKPKNYSFIS